MFEAVFAGQSRGLLMWMSNPAWPSMVWQTYDARYDINGGFQGCKDGCRSVNAIYDVLREELCLINATALDRQLTLAGCDDRRALPYHRALLSGELPLTIGGGIGQSRVSMLLLGKAHIGEVQASIWDDATVRACEDAGVMLL